jgi:hypothetical protein
MTSLPMILRIASGVSQVVVVGLVGRGERDLDRAVVVLRATQEVHRRHRIDSRAATDVDLTEATEALDGQAPL